MLGAAFGICSYSRDRTELAVFMNPRAIYDTNQITAAREERKFRLRRYIKE